MSPEDTLIGASAKCLQRKEPKQEKGPETTA